jgi:hypothetical protein
MSDCGKPADSIDRLRLEEQRAEIKNHPLLASAQLLPFVFLDHFLDAGLIAERVKLAGACIGGYSTAVCANPNTYC